VIDIRVPVPGRPAIVEHADTMSLEVLCKSPGGAHLTAGTLPPDPGGLRLVYDPGEQHAKAAEPLPCVLLAFGAAAFVLALHASSGRTLSHHWRRRGAALEARQGAGPTIPQGFPAHRERAPTDGALARVADPQALG
jgi:hypothetical protein